MSYNKRYTPVLPLRDDEKIIDQFGWNPLSIIDPTRESKAKWDFAYFPQDDTEIRRMGGADYLPPLQFSEFHAGLCESMVRYWSLKGSRIVDPFAGRATRAVVSTKLGREYYGYDVSEKTIERSKELFKGLDINPTLYHADGCKLEHTTDNFADLVMTCPPYWNIEVYEDADNQLSRTDSYEDFLAQIKICGENIYRVLKPGAFALWVCADFRGAPFTNQSKSGKAGGSLYTFHNDTINLFNQAGLATHDIIIIKNNSPFAAFQTAKVAAKRYTSKTHEYLLVFRKPGEYVVPDYCSLDGYKETAKKFFTF